MEKKTNGQPVRILISGGGTGGHIFPALSIAGAVRRRHPDAEILFVGAENRMEMERVPAAGYDIVGLPVSGFNRSNMLGNFKVLFQLWKSMRRARKIVKDFRPDIAVGVGGYASGPTLKAAQKAGVPTLLQEQNSYPGVTNKLLGKNAKAICVAYSGTERFFPADRIVMTGNPVRENIVSNTMTAPEAKKHLGFAPDKPLLLVVGGSLGARTINSAIIGNALSGDVEEHGFQVLWQTGGADADRCREEFEKARPESVRVEKFISEMDVAYRAADLVIARAGAATISELQLLGKPAILVPSPNVAEDHQRKNAQALVDRHAAVMVLDAEAGEKLWPEALELIDDPGQRAALSENIRKMALTGADEKIADQIDKIIANNR